MRKKFMAVSCLMMAALTFGACGDRGNTTSDSSSGGSSGNAGYISTQVQDLGSSFNAEYYPVEEKIEQRQGKIDVVILFEGTETAWQAVAKEYMRLHSNAVVVSLDTKYSSGTYADKLNSEMTSGQSEWDIVQGNVAAGSNLRTYGLNMSSSISSKNAYAGDKFWSQVLMEDAYITDKAGTDTTTYVMNSEGLQTAWFVNDVAFAAAVEKGYLNANGEAENPVTWDDLISLCGYMQQAGYENPLGISVNRDSINATQLTWLMRIYGDLYYRNEYNKIMKEEYDVDLTAENPEGDLGYKVVHTKLYNLILDESSENYVGATSDKYKEFLSQFYKMRPYLTTDAAELSMEQMRNDFQYQNKGKKSPQIMLDYAGSGLAFAQNEDEEFKMDFFDYPMMVSEYVTEGTLLRDVGGNGGYLSIINHGKQQNELNLDFMKFFMSPYGQTIYYQAMSEAGAAPKGLTTVVNDYVGIPESWVEFFRTDKISFTGLSDNNPFVSCLIRYMQKESNTVTKGEELWMKYLTGTGSDAIDTVMFSGQWADSLKIGWKSYCKKNGWNENCYKYPGEDVSYGG